MTNPRYEPRSFCKFPAHFGSFETVWIDVPPTDFVALDRRGAAQIQHVAALRMRRAIVSSPHKTIEKYAASIGADPSRLARMLRGTIVMRLEDMVNAERNLPIRAWPGGRDATEPPAPDTPQSRLAALMVERDKRRA